MNTRTREVVYHLLILSHEGCTSASTSRQVGVQVAEFALS
jgi:hypothetical protein